MTWVYKRSEPGLWTVGFYDPAGKWHPDSDHGTREEAAQRVHYLNGGGEPTRRSTGWRYDDALSRLLWDRE